MKDPPEAPNAAAKKLEQRQISLSPRSYTNQAYCWAAAVESS